VQRDGHAVELPHGAVLGVGPGHPETELQQKVERSVRVGDSDLGLLAYLDAPFEPGRALGREKSAWASVEDPKAHGRIPSGRAGTIEAIVLLAIPPVEVSAPLAQHRAELPVVARALQPKFQLAFDGAVTELSARAAAGHCVERLTS